MKKTIKITIALLLCFNLLSIPAFARELMAVGQVVGLELSDNSVTVAAFDMELGGAAQKAGLCVGDQILKIDGKTVRCAEDVRRALQSSKGAISMKVQRQGKDQELKLAPEITADGPKLGVFLKQGVTGIGTVTWYDPESGQFGTLGHGVNTPAGQLVKMASGVAYRARVAAVTKGQVGHPGQLQGAVNAKDVIGTLMGNTAQGVFGTAENGWAGKMMEVATAEEVQVGSATIRSTIEGNTVREYSVEILKIYPKSRSTGRNLMIRVTDPDLLATTGGIVQGMSGSPIIQNGKLIGAVTHVLVNDPTTGYGIFIENMLAAAG